MKGEEITTNIEALKAQLVSLIRCKPNKFDAAATLPSKGVYAIWDRKNLLYVGKSTRLQKRLLRDHRSGNRRGSAFRRALSENKGLDEPATTDYIANNCYFRYLDAENISQIEHFAIAVLKPTLNK